MSNVTLSRKPAARTAPNAKAPSVLNPFLSRIAARGALRAAMHADTFSDAVEAADDATTDDVGKARGHQSAASAGVLRLAGKLTINVDATVVDGSTLGDDDDAE